MPSAIELYHEKKVALDAITEELTAMKDNLVAAAKALEPLILDDYRFDFHSSFNIVPDQAAIVAALSRHRNAQAEVHTAFAALSEIEKIYVRAHHYWK
jgi:hypothetical protein